MSAALPLERRNRRVALYAAMFGLAMLGLGYASVPLYRLFCQVTGFGGTTQRIGEAQAAAIKPVVGKTISIRFDGNVAAGLPWEFRPDQVTDTVAIGARDMTTFYARNTSARSVTGTATFNVTPERAGRYFTKIQCFCFTEQTLAPGQEVHMPVIYFVDPKILDDPQAKDIEQITLSYTFNELRAPLDRAATAR